MSDTFPRPFGRYQLVERLAIGGMAELFVARASGAEGFEKTLVIKQLLPELATDEQFRTMFIDEAKITARLVHPKIAQTYELGRHDDQLYIAMEYVDGIDGLALLRELAHRGQRAPAHLIAFLIKEVLDALDFAHNQVDAEGREMCIVHRDVSPSNVLLSRRGNVKLVDFGIARAVEEDQRTRAGTLKGKYGYMSPEQVVGKKLDARSDVFSAGVVMAEMLMGRRLFAAPAELDVLLMVRDAKLERLDRFGADIDQDLDMLLRCALSKDRDQRFPSAGEFRDQLDEWLFSRRLRVTPKEMAELVASIYEAAHGRRRSDLATAERPEPVVRKSAVFDPTPDEPGRPSRDARARAPTVRARPEQIDEVDALAESDEIDGIPSGELNSGDSLPISIESLDLSIADELQDSPQEGSVPLDLGLEPSPASDSAGAPDPGAAIARLEIPQASREPAVAPAAGGVADAGIASLELDSPVDGGIGSLELSSDDGIGSLELESPDSAGAIDDELDFGSLMSDEPAAPADDGIGSLELESPDSAGAIDDELDFGSLMSDEPAVPAVQAQAPASDLASELDFGEGFELELGGYDGARAPAVAPAEPAAPQRSADSDFESIPIDLDDLAEDSEPVPAAPAAASRPVPAGVPQPLMDISDKSVRYASIADAVAAVSPQAPDPSAMDFDDSEVSAPTAAVPSSRSRKIRLPSADELAGVPDPDPPGISDLEQNPDQLGTLTEVHPLRVLYSLVAEGATGMLMVSIGGIRKEIYVTGGEFEFVSSNVAKELFGEYLVSHSAISDGELSMALAMMPHYGGKMGDTLVGLGLMKPLEVFRYLSRQVRDKLVDVCTWTKGDYAWYEGRANPREAFPLDLDPYEVLGAGAVAVPQDYIVNWARGELRRKPKAVKQPSVELTRFGLGDAVKQVCSLLDGERSLVDLRARYDDKRKRIRFLRILHLVLQTELAI